MTAFDRPHFGQPFHRDSKTGKMACVEQDTPEHIRSCEYTIAACATGARLERPEFGWDQPVMRSMPVDFGGLVDAIKTSEPRAQDVTTSQAESVYGEVVQVTTRTETASVN